MGFVWSSSAPHRVVSEYTRGQCFSLAIALHRRHGLPLYGAKDASGLIHHVFVVYSGRAVDIRGSMSLDTVARGSKADGGTIVHVHVADIYKQVEDYLCWGLHLTKADIRKAYRTVDRYLRRIENA